MRTHIELHAFEHHAQLLERGCNNRQSLLTRGQAYGHGRCTLSYTYFTAQTGAPACDGSGHEFRRQDWTLLQSDKAQQDSYATHLPLHMSPHVS
jgi:hypothetical protein